MEAAFGIVGEPPPGDQRPRGSLLQRLAPLGVFVGAAGFAAGLTCVYLGMRELMKSKGGVCASGGPYAVAAGHQCGGETALLFGGIVGLLVFGAVFAGFTGAGGGAGGVGSGMDAGFLMWAALFGALGFNFLSLGFDPPDGQSGAGGWIVCGVIFELMALGGVVPLVWSARESVARGGAPEGPLFRGPQVRAKVNEGLVNVPAPPPGPRAPLPKSLNIPRRDWRAP